MDAFCGDWDTVVYLLRTATRCMSGEPRFCEFLYIHGAGRTGKDVFMGILMQWFGIGTHNLGLVMGGHWITEGKAPKEGASPFLANTKGRRAIWLSEVPKHQGVHQDLIKAFCEQGGAPITTRKLWRAPESFRPIGGLFGTSNFSLCTLHPEDDGFERRARVLETRVKFVPAPVLLTERRADDTLKSRIDGGSFDSQLFAFAALLYETLSPEVSPGTELEPRPGHMCEAEKEIFCRGPVAECPLLPWLLSCTPASRNEGIDAVTLRAAVMKDLKLDAASLKVAAQKAGLDLRGKVNANARRVVLRKHPNGGLGLDALQLPASSSS
jgi:hypothetical protein